MTPQHAEVRSTPLGLYLHVPFCASICRYCHFNRVVLDPPRKAPYVRALAAEIGRAGCGASADSIYFGGGTPSVLEPEEVQVLVEACRASFAVADDVEISLEANPETATIERLQGYRAVGVNRLSLGVQSFNDEELARLGRRHSADRARSAYHAAREVGFETVSLDLMMWLPGQTATNCQASVAELVRLEPDHASLYLLELDRDGPLQQDLIRPGWALGSEDDAADMYLDALTKMREAGYQQYEISNLARAGKRCRHNLKYWEDGEWVGFGCGAHSTRAGARWHNVAGVDDYIQRVAAGGDPIEARHRLSREVQLQDAMVTGLRLTGGVDLTLMGQRYGADLAERYGAAVGPFVEAGALVLERGRLRLTPSGMLVANEVMAVFL